MSMPQDRAYAELLQRVALLEAERDGLRRELAALRQAAHGGHAARAPAHSHLGLRAPAEDQWEAPSTTAPVGPGPVRAETIPFLTAPGALVEDRASFDLGRMRQLRREELDGLPYGLVVLDAQGTVLAYNDTESRMAGLRKERVVGRNFFADIAPCTRVREFEGRFREFARAGTGRMFESFDFVFRFERETQHVTIYVSPGRQRGTFNVAMLRRKVEPRG